MEEALRFYILTFSEKGVTVFVILFYRVTSYLLGFPTAVS